MKPSFYMVISSDGTIDIVSHGKQKLSDEEHDAIVLHRLDEHINKYWSKEDGTKIISDLLYALKGPLPNIYTQKIATILSTPRPRGGKKVDKERLRNNSFYIPLMYAFIMAGGKRVFGNMVNSEYVRAYLLELLNYSPESKIVFDKCMKDDDASSEYKYIRKKANLLFREWSGPNLRLPTLDDVAELRGALVRMLPSEIAETASIVKNLLRT